MCCSLESGSVLSHGSGGKGYGLATTAVTSGCFIWKVWTGVFFVSFLKKSVVFFKIYRVVRELDTCLTSLLSSTLPKRTEATRARAWAFHGGLSKITTTIPPLTCGCIVPTAGTCTMEANWSAHFHLLARVTPSPASWTWRLTPFHLLRTTRSVDTNAGAEVFKVSLGRNMSVSQILSNKTNK